MKKILCLLLAIMLVIQPAVPVFAYTGDTLGSLKENRTILEKLRNLYGEDLTEDDIIRELSGMGLLDEDGNLNVSESIMVDGTPMTLEQVKRMLCEQDADLSRVVSVDGTELTLADLKTMIEIEEELSRLKREYFSGAAPLTEEHRDSLTSLFNQMESEGITMLSDSTEVPINHDLRIKVIIKTKTNFTNLSEDDGVILQFTVIDKNGTETVLPYDISFKIRTLDGSAKDGIHYRKENETVTIPQGMSNVFKTITVKAFSSNNTSDMRWDGKKVFYIQVYEPNNILFEGDSRAVNIPVTLNKTYAWIHQMSYTFEDKKIFIRDDGAQRDPSYYTFASYMNPDIYSNLQADENLVRLYNDFITSAEDIHGSFEKAKFEYYPYILLHDPFKQQNTMEAYPLLQDMYGVPIANAEYGKVISVGVDYFAYHTHKIAMEMMPENPVDPYGTQLYFRTYGALPEYVSFMEATYSSEAFKSGNYLSMLADVGEYYEIIDKSAPTVKSIKASSAVTSSAIKYYSGQIVPVTVEFSEPVKLKDIEMTIQGEDTVLEPEESSTISKYATFLYEVPKEPDSSLVIKSIRNITDLKNNKTSVWPADGHLTTISGVEMIIDKVQAFKSIKLGNEPAGGIYAPNQDIIVKLDVDTDISQWLEQQDEFDVTKKQLKRVYIKANGYTYPLIMGGEGALEGSYFTAEIPASRYAAVSQQDLNIELYMDGTYYSPSGASAYFEGGTVVYGKTAKTSVAPVVLVSEVVLDTASYPENNKIYLTSEISTQLKASVNPADATFGIISWKSSNESIAIIDEATGTIAPVSQGSVVFTAVADNGGFGAVQASTPEFTIADGGPPAIVFPLGNNAFTAKKNETANIVWSQNLINRTEGVPAVFTIEIYEGNYPDKESIDDSKLIHTASVTDVNKYTVPANILSIVSNKTDPAYTVKVSSANPDNTALSLSATGFIIVYPQPAKVKLSVLDSYYITDETSKINIGWSLSEFTGGSFEFKVDKNGAVIYSDNSSTANGSYTLSIGEVPDGILKDIYTVTAKAKNASDSSWSTDSFVLHVYDKDSMKILVDNQDVDEATMDNNSYISRLYQNSGSQGILDLKRDIYLKRFIGINYGQYPWGSITDQVKWKSDNSKIASVNYKQGSLYENIEKFDYISYRPSTQFMLAGNTDGSTVITATHAATGMTDTLNVNVATLKNKLYIFNFYPKQETELEYTNGSGQLRRLKTNNDGEIAVYEESGIAGSISLKSGSDSDLYLGTLYNERLVTAEKDPGIYELYPVNIFELRPAAKVELFFKSSEGKPFSGQVTYRGAVYKNGKICNETIESDGELLVVGSDGRFTLNFDSTKFWTEDNTEKLSGFDKLMFIYEVIFQDSYYPQLIEANGNISVEDVVKFGESIVNLVPVNAADMNKPFVHSHKINYNLPGGRTLDVTNYTGSVGPSNIYNKADLETTVTWWGYEKKDGYDVKIEDEYGNKIPGQKVKTILYPFAEFAYTKNITTMSEDSLNLDIGEKKNGGVNIYNTDGSLIKNVNCPFSFTNMVGAPSAQDDDRGVKKAAEDLNDSGDLEFDGSMVNNGDGMIGIALGLMSGTTLGGQLMNLKIIATEDPMIYRGLITMQQGLGDTDASSVTVDVGGVENSFDYTPDPAEMMDLMQKSADDIEKELQENMEKTVSGDVDYGLTFTGDFEVEVRYDEQEQKWIMIVIGGGFDVDALIGYTWTVNQMVGPVPLTAEFGLGAATKLEFRAVKPYGNVPSNINAADVNDFFTALRIKLYLSAFGGFGFDYSIIALKIGVFGKINLDYELEFLTRSYLDPPPQGYGQLYGIELGLSGQVGIKFVAKFLFVSYEAVLASYEYTVDLWEEGNPELIEQWKKSQKSSLFGSNFINQMYASSMRLKTVKENINLEDRDYLSLYDREWNSPSAKRMMSTSGVTDILTNSYPYANPVTTRDGSIMAYMSDSGSTNLNETRASWAIKAGGGYTDMGALPQPSSVAAYADNNIKIDGTVSFAAVAWEQQGVEIADDGIATSEDITAMINSSEIMAGIYDGSSWHTAALTDNLVSDMSPVVAANGGRAVVAWRSLAGSSMTDGDLSYDDVNDAIMYRVYEGGHWSEDYTLYNGAAGNVKGLSAAMMEDGTAAVAYTLDSKTEHENPAYGYETVCALIDGDNDVVTDIRLTNNDSADRNPQIAVVDFGIDEGERFVVGWHNATRKGISDIKLAAIDSAGKIDNSFIDSISSVNENSAVKISDNFRFVKGENLSLNDLSIIWVEPTLEYNDELNKNAENDCIKAVKFMTDEGGKIYLTAALNVATMDDYTLIDHLDAYSGGTNSVNAVLLCSSYIGELEDHGGIYTVDSISSMKYASAVYENNIKVDDIYINYPEIKNGFRLPLRFTVTNMGIEPIDTISINLQPDKVTEIFEKLMLLPNQTVVLNIDYNVPDEAEGIHDLNYTLTASFSDSDEKEKTGYLNLDVPDTGIAKVELVSDEQGKRVMQLILNNLSNIALAGSGNRKVYAGMYTSSEFIDESTVGVEEITGTDLELLDEGALTKRFTYNVPAAGIPNGGARLYARIWVEEKIDGKYNELVEYNPANNVKSILIPNPSEANNGNKFLVSIEQENADGSTTAHITVKNLSMTPSFNGNVVAYLLDDTGSIIETKFLALTRDELLALGGEESAARDIVFTKQGARVTAAYFTADPESMEPEIAKISLSGITMSFNSLITDYELTAVNLDETLIVAAAKNMAHTVEIKNAADNRVLASGAGAATYRLALSPDMPVTVIITAANTQLGTVTDSYRLSITGTKKTGGGVIITAPAKSYNSAQVNVTAENLTDFMPVKWQLQDNGEWSEVMSWNTDGNKCSVSGLGSHTIMARLFDEEGYYMDSNSLTLSIQRRSDGSETKTEPEPEIVPQDIFKDVNSGFWYYEAVTYLAEQGIIHGMGNGMFEPESNIKRADFLIMVMNAFGITLEEEISDNFADAGNNYYTKYLGTAKKMGLVSGTGGNMFAPESLITRQDMTVILYRISDKLGRLPESAEAAVFDEFMDKEEIADYAKEAMKTFVESKIISGYDNRLHPLGLTTRAQAAQILYNMLK